MKDTGRKQIGQRVRVFYEQDQTNSGWDSADGNLAVVVDFNEQSGGGFTYTVAEALLANFSANSGTFFSSSL